MGKRIHHVQTTRQNAKASPTCGILGNFLTPQIDAQDSNHSYGTQIENKYGRKCLICLYHNLNDQQRGGGGA
jgi:hypothetical protein